jgi:hypothetical protein
MRTLLCLALAAMVLSLAGSAGGAARKERSPRNSCRLDCRKAYQKCIRKKSAHPYVCFRARKKCYKVCRRTLPPTPRPRPPETPRPRGRR